MQEAKHLEGLKSACQASEWKSWKSALGGFTALAPVLLSISVLRFLWVAFRRPERFDGTTLLNTWYKPTYKDPEGRLHCEKTGERCLDVKPLLGLVTRGSLAAIVLWAFRSLDLLERSKEQGAECHRQSAVSRES